MKTTLLLTVALSICSGLALKPPAFAQNKPQKRAEKPGKRETKELSGRIIKGKLLSLAGKSLMLTPEGGAPLKVEVLETSVFHPTQGEAKLSSFKVKQDIVGELELAQGVWTLRELWDTTSWTANLAKHEGVQSGTITQINGRILELGALRFSLTKETAWTKQGKPTERASFKVGESVSVTGNTSTGVPVATQVTSTTATAPATTAPPTKNPTELRRKK